MSRRIHGKAVHHRLDREVFELPEVIRIVLLIHANDSAGTSGINAAETRIEFDSVGALGERQMRNRAARIQREHSESSTAAAKQECPVMFRVHCHPVVALASFHRMLAVHGIRVQGQFPRPGSRSGD
jgi:hypothetical protein